MFADRIDKREPQAPYIYKPLQLSHHQPRLTMHSNDASPQFWPWFQPPPTTQQQPLPRPPIVYPIVMQQLLVSQANTMPCCGGCTMILHSYSSLFCVDPVYQSMAQQYQHQYRAPSSGPSRNQRSKGRRKAEAQDSNQISHESSGTIGRVRYAGIHLGHARTDAKDNTGAGGAWRPPTRNPLLVDRNSPWQKQTTPYNRHRSGSQTRRSRRDKADLSVYEIPIVDSERNAMTRVSSIPALVPPRLSTWATASASSTAAPAPTSASATSPSRAYAETTTNTDAQKQLVEEDDFDTISLGSDTDYQY